MEVARHTLGAQGNVVKGEVVGYDAAPTVRAKLDARHNVIAGAPAGRYSGPAGVWVLL